MRVYTCLSPMVNGSFVRKAKGKKAQGKGGEWEVYMLYTYLEENSADRSRGSTKGQRECGAGDRVAVSRVLSPLRGSNIHVSLYRDPSEN